MEGSRAVRNSSAVLIFVISASALIFSVVYDFVPNGAIGGLLGVLQFLFEYFPGAIFIAVGSVTLGFGTRKLTSVVGANRWGQAIFCVWAILTLVSVIAVVGSLFGDPLTAENARHAQQYCGIGGIVFGLAAAFFVLRGRVVLGFARVAMFIAVALYAVTEFLTQWGDASTNYLWDLPRLAGVVILGLSWWHAGVTRRVTTVNG
jgi:hypothetical protein